MSLDFAMGRACCVLGQLPDPDRVRVEQLAAAVRATDPLFARWALGAGPIKHDALTQVRVHGLCDLLIASGKATDRAMVINLLIAADQLTLSGMWLVAHMSYAQRVYLDGRELQAEDFKASPEGHMGGSLNMVPGYVGYLAANALTAQTRAWVMGQGHCVAAIDAVNLWVDNLSPEQAARYGHSAEQLSRFVNDFYSYRIRPDGRPDSPLGSHVGASTAGGVLEGGYLGFAELLYPHMVLPGERLVAFLSDGAFEEQRGSDWAPRWWRPEDCGHIAPIMVLNGRRIEQRTAIAQSGGERWLHQHLRLNGFEPVGIDGRDPASYVWGILEIEARLDAEATALQQGCQSAVRLGYGIAEAPKGFGFPGAASNRAHNLPLPGNPSVDPEARQMFNEAIRALRVGPVDRDSALRSFQVHQAQGRPRERDNPVATRRVRAPQLPEPVWMGLGVPDHSPMAALDQYFVAIVLANPSLRPRVGNPDELRSNKLNLTLDTLKHRVWEPEAGIAESVNGAVITALNEECVVSAALGNKAGINLVVTYEAFGTKMLGALRQEIIFARHLVEAGRAPDWLAVPIVLTSHTWENAKNEQSHQDPTLAEALMGEMSDCAGVLFPVDTNSTLAMVRQVYSTRHRIVAMVIPKRPVPVCLDPSSAQQLAIDGVLPAPATDSAYQLILVATGAYQWQVVSQAGRWLRASGVHCGLCYLADPSRLRIPRDSMESKAVASDSQLTAWFPPDIPRVFVTHTRPEPYLGMLRRIDTGPATTRALGYCNRGGTLDVNGLLFANGCSPAHIVAAAAQVMARAREDFLTPPQCAAIDGTGDPKDAWTSQA